MTQTATVSRDTPLRLARALELAYPEGGMTISGLRREIARGRLKVERTAGKTFVTLADIDRMRDLCRVPVSLHGSGSLQRGQGARLSGSSSTTDASVALAAALKTAEALKRRSQPTSEIVTTPPRKVSVDGPGRRP